MYMPLIKGAMGLYVGIAGSNWVMENVVLRFRGLKENVPSPIELALTPGELERLLSGPEGALIKAAIDRARMMEQSNNGAKRTDDV